MFLIFSGEMDTVTVETMQLPRCGVKDKIGKATERSKRYALQGRYNHSYFL